MNSATTASHMLTETVLPLTAIAIQLVLLLVMGFHIGRNGKHASLVIQVCIVSSIILCGGVFAAGKVHW
ncbi:hypothetical protein MB02_01270 [Croceicoccus estronivorus]|uniref:hypothetical protein n=1 Tax=Croceicoccus estronivorus TaxID=1172626 RepID=UPI00082A1089|nr:hypothetical protein [Croceicoccus estronivorus]OCC25330.1 hypothetical protein MB02_01270 [Croceicoccus estronivorus]